MKKVLLCLIAALALYTPLSQAVCTLVPFRLLTDTGGQLNSGVRYPSQCREGRTLAASTAETHTVPSGARIVLFSSDCSFYAAPGASVALLTTDITDGTASELNPSTWGLDGTVTQISVIAETVCHVTFQFYR